MVNDKEKEYTFNTCWRDGPALLPMSSPADQAIVETTSPGEQVELGTVPELVLTPTFGFYWRIGKLPEGKIAIV